MQSMPFNNKNELQDWWDEMNKTYSKEEIDQAIATLKPDAQKVIRWHYEHSLPLKDIAPILSRSLTIIRSHQYRGIYLLHKYFKQKK